MSKSWLTLIIIATVTLLAWTAFQFYVALTGQANQDFNYIVTPLSGTLPEELLTKIGSEEEKIPVKVDDIRVEEPGTTELE